MCFSEWPEESVGELLPHPCRATNRSSLRDNAHDLRYPVRRHVDVIDAKRTEKRFLLLWHRRVSVIDHRARTLLWDAFESIAFAPEDISYDRQNHPERRLFRWSLTYAVRYFSRSWNFCGIEAKSLKRTAPLASALLHLLVVVINAWVDMSIRRMASRQTSSKNLKT